MCSLRASLGATKPEGIGVVKIPLFIIWEIDRLEPRQLHGEGRERKRGGSGPNWISWWQQRQWPCISRLGAPLLMSVSSLSLLAVRTCRPLPSATRSISVRPL
ncbi:hypothetical protein Zm00014a_005028 [Zea mays]|uniref:Uncharacterized protein n=1 Tax=Zea mays TaxID=4577 RepID=A0A3L6DVI5_MAIZE|nr:hypothetical protein Zm00014a_005028 [Zea mays]